MLSGNPLEDEILRQIVALEADMAAAQERVGVHASAYLGACELAIEIAQRDLIGQNEADRRTSLQTLQVLRGSIDV